MLKILEDEAVDELRRYFQRLESDFIEASSDFTITAAWSSAPARRFETGARPARRSSGSYSPRSSSKSPSQIIIIKEVDMMNYELPKIEVEAPDKCKVDTIPSRSICPTSHLRATYWF